MEEQLNRGVPRSTSIRRRIGLGMAMSSVLVVIGGVVFAGVSVASAAADDERSRQAVVEAAASLDELPTIEPVVPVDPADAASSGADGGIAAAVDYSRTPEGWYDATTDPADVVIPEVNEWGETNDGIWEAQRQVSAKCMAEQGFWYAWTNVRANADGPYGTMILTEESEAARLALGGTNPSDRPYDWRLAGCDGYAVHVTGMDDAH